MRANRTVLVYTNIVRNITLSAEADLIERARQRAAQEKRTLNAAFREWLERYAATGTDHEEYTRLMKRLSHIRSGRSFSRDEMNER